MAKRLLIAVPLVLAVLLLPLRASAPMCGMSMPAPQKMHCTACCATMKSCALPQQDPTQPTTASTVAQQSIALIAPALPVLSRELPTPHFAAPRFAAPSVSHSPPRLALFCSFLI